MQSQRIENPLPPFIIASILAYTAYETRDYMGGEFAYVPIACAGVAALLYFSFTIIMLFSILPQLIRYYFIRRPKGRAGTAGWASKKELKKAGLFKKRGFLMGLFGRRAVFVDIESNGLVISPAGGGKTSKVVIPALAFNLMSMLVIDLKATLYPTTGRYREKYLGADIIVIDPAGMCGDEDIQKGRYNPLQILIDDWADPKLRTHLYADAKSMALQLYPEPANGGENRFWRNGSRKLLTFAFLYHVTISGNATLSACLDLLSDVESLTAAIDLTKSTDILGGDLARLAKDFHAKLENGDPKQIESFREGAVQVLEPFSPSGVLAENTSTCDFRFSEMRKKKITIYLMADPTRQKVFAPWIALLSFCAITELIRQPKGQRVCFMCDEATNFKIDGLPQLLTLAREFRIIVWIIIQELEQWAYVYGREGADTLLSQSEVKLILGAGSYKAAKLISDMLGETSQVNMNHSLGISFFDPVTRSTSEGGRALRTADEVRRMDEAILFVGKLRPIRLKAIGYNQISPWKSRLGINPLFGKPYKGITKLRL